MRKRSCRVSDDLEDILVGCSSLEPCKKAPAMCKKGPLRKTQEETKRDAAFTGSPGKRDVRRWQE
jgi:hypothetical protein